RIELYGPPQMFDRFLTRAHLCERGAEVPLGPRRVRLEARRFPELTDGFVDAAALGERDADRVVQIGGVGNNSAKVGAAEDEAWRAIGEATETRRLFRRRRVGVIEQR